MARELASTRQLATFDGDFHRFGGLELEYLR
jgi:hypothetical protein